VGGLEDWRIIEGFVAAHPEAKGVADEDLLYALALGEFLDHLQGIADRAIQFGIAAVNDLAAAVHGLVDVLQQVTSGFSCPVLFSDDFVPPASLCSNVMTMAGKWWFDSMGGTSVTGYNWPIGSGKV